MGMWMELERLLVILETWHIYYITVSVQIKPKVFTFFFDLSDFLEMFFTFVWRWYKTLGETK